MYQSPYLAATAPGSLMPLPATQLSHAAALAATSQFYEYQNAAAMAAAATAPYTGQYPNGFDAYTPYAGTAGKCRQEFLQVPALYVHMCVTRSRGLYVTVCQVYLLTQFSDAAKTRSCKLPTK